MSASSEKMVKFIEAFDKGKKISAVVSIAFVLGAIVVHEYYALEALLVGALSIWVMHWLINLVLIAFYKNKFFGKEAGPEEILDSLEELYTELETEDASDQIVPPTQHISVTVKNLPENPIGKFLDADIYEWIDVIKPDGEIVRFNFTGTINPEKQSYDEIPSGSFVVPPGIIYQVATV